MERYLLQQYSIREVVMRPFAIILVVFMAFVVAGVLLAWMDRLTATPHE